MAISAHPYIMGAPHRLKYFRQALEEIRRHDDVPFWTGEQTSTGTGRSARAEPPKQRRS